MTRGRTAAILAAGYVLLDQLLVPQAPRHIAYILSAETGAWAPTEFAHPLFVPVLVLLRWLAGGHLLAAAQALNSLAAGVTVALLFLIAERRTEDRLLSCACALLFGFSRGFWLQHIRPMPYSLAALFLVWGLWSQRAWAVGIAGAVSSLFTLASGAVLPALAWRRKSAAVSWIAVCLAGAGAFFLYRGVDPRHLSWERVFFEVEQVRGSSIWSSGSWAAQLGDLFQGLGSNLGGELLVVSAAVLALGRRVFEVRALWAGLLLVLFFLVNNTQNGFLCMAALVPFAVAVGADKRTKPAVVAAALLLGIGAVMERWSGDMRLGGAFETEPAFLEGKFLRMSMRDQDAVLVPSEPEAGFDYFFGLNMVRPGDGIERRIKTYLCRGKRVLLAEWQTRDEEFGRAELFQHELLPTEQARRVERLKGLLAKEFRLGRPMRGPSGQLYTPLALKKKRPARTGEPGSWGDWPVMGYRFKRFQRVLRADPGDAYAFSDLASAYREEGLWQAAEECLEAALAADPGIKDHVSAQRNGWKAVEHKDKGVGLFLQGDTFKAIFEFGRALELDPVYGEALLSRGAALDKAGELDAALQDYSKAVELVLEPASMRADALSSRANTWLKKGREDRAAADLRAALATAPRFWQHRAETERQLRELNK